MHQDQEKRIFTLNQRRGRKECHLVEGVTQGDRGGLDQEEDEQRVRETRRSRRTRSGGGRAACSFRKNFRKKQTFRKSTFELLENRVKDELLIKSGDNALEVKCQKLWARGFLEWMESKTCEALNGMKPNPREDIVCQEWSRTSSVDSACQEL